jgi:hypothetical protein
MGGDWRVRVGYEHGRRVRSVDHMAPGATAGSLNRVAHQMRVIQLLEQVPEPDRLA